MFLRFYSVQSLSEPWKPSGFTLGKTSLGQNINLRCLQRDSSVVPPRQALEEKVTPANMLQKFVHMHVIWFDL